MYLSVKSMGQKDRFRKLGTILMLMIKVVSYILFFGEKIAFLIDF